MSIWGIIIALGLLTYLTRFGFLGLLGDRTLPDWLLRHLRYTGVAVLPGLVAPLVVWPHGQEAGLDAVWLLAAGVTLVIGVWRKDVIQAVLGGGLAFALLSALL